jgi:malate synthase
LLVVDEVELRAPPGIRENVRLESWLRGVGAAAINNLMEDAATSEISRAQIWQWIRHGKTERSHVREIEEAALEKLATEGRWDEARALFDRVALEEEFKEFLTLPAYEYLD